MMQLGIREFMAPPFHHGSVGEVLTRVRDTSEKRPPSTPMTDMLYSFLPSKPGSGTTTIAVNTAIAMARQPDTNNLLMDMDLNCGLVRFMLKIDNSYSILDAAENALSMDDALWQQLVTKRGRMDVLHAGKINPGVRMEGSQVRHMIEYARKTYKSICVDLSGNMEKYSMEIMRESKRIFLVCTPEIPSLHLAREKFLFLEHMDLADRVSILLNRMTKNPVISPQQIETLLGMPVAMTLPNDYSGVHRAVTSGKEVDPTSELGRHFTHLATTMLEKRRPNEGGKAKKESKSFAEFFKLVPTRYAEASESKAKN
jgi:pilus assembly protein CpaE